MRVLGPFAQFEARAGENVPKACVFPFTRIVEAIKVKMPDGSGFHLVRLHHSVGRAFDAALHAQCAQQVADPSGFAGAQIALQRQTGVQADAAQPYGQLGGKGGCVGLISPDQGFYNGCLVQGSSVLINHAALLTQIQIWAHALGFSQIAVAPVDLSSAEPGLSRWLAQHFHGEMDYMARHGMKRARPAELVPGTLSVLTARMNYLPADTPSGWQAIEWQRLKRPEEAVISLYARGRDYHKVLRQRLDRLARQIDEFLQLPDLQEGLALQYRAFTDSAPVLEVELATRSGLGWRGKHSLVLHREAGSMFFLGEIFLNLALPPTPPVSAHCGQCRACMDVCPTQAIVEEGVVDARRCISYLTIEHAGSIPEALRPLIGNRIYGCDDCQLVCPWNKYAQPAVLADFAARDVWDEASLQRLLRWSEDEFLRHTEGSAIRRIGHARWLRNLAVASGNALRQQHDAALREVLQTHLTHPDPVVREHVAWALAQSV